jgi:hypothetical protein
MRERESQRERERERERERKTDDRQTCLVVALIFNLFNESISSIVSDMDNRQCTRSHRERDREIERETDTDAQTHKHTDTRNTCLVVALIFNLVAIQKSAVGCL